MDKLFRTRVVNSTGAAQNISGSGSITTDSIHCRGAKAVHFIIVSTSGDTDTFAASGAFNLRFQTAAEGTVTEGSAPAVVTVSSGLNGVAGNVGGIVSVYPTGGPDSRIAAYSLGGRIVAGASQIDNVLVRAMVTYV